LTSANDAASTMSERTRIAVFCPEFFLPYSQTFIADELGAHVRYEADVFALGRQNEQRFRYPRVHTPRGVRALVRYLATSRLPAFDDVFEARRPRLVHAHFGTAAVFAYPYARRHGVPLVVTFHGYDVAILLGRGRALPHRWRYWALSRSILGEAAALLCASEELCELVQRLGAPAERVKLHRLGIDVDRYRRAPEVRPEPRVTMIGRFVEKKGHLDGIEAFARAIAAGYSARLSIVGSGLLEARYRRLVAERGISGRVTFHGVLDGAAVAELLGRSDVLLAPSHVARNGDRESGLLVVREAGAAAVPVIGTVHGGIPESIEDGRTGYLVGERDVEQLTRRLCRLIADGALRERLGAAARAKMQAEFRLDQRVAALESIYDQVLAFEPAATHGRRR
jgi:colanic acid/amylovoran biosynthesis glycosyltransferase